MEQLLARYFAGEATGEERKEVEEWRAASPENASIFFESKQLWILSEGRTDKGPAVSDTVGRKTIFLGRHSMKYAAVIVLLILAGLLWLGKERETVVHAAELMTFDLPDGSRVTLKSGAELKVGQFDHQRQVELSGKAYFDVMKNPEKPFVVRSGGAVVTVTGTTFVVDGMPENISVYVESGEVTVAAEDSRNSDSVILRSGEAGQIIKDQAAITKGAIEDPNYLSWKSRIISFRETRMEEVARVIEDVYGARITFENPQLRDCRLTASFDRKTSDEVVRIIARTFDFSIILQDGHIMYSGESCK